ncbi:MAG: hypothetical protein ACXWYB_13265 [Aeromicrobium sp.]
MPGDDGIASMWDVFARDVSERLAGLRRRDLHGAAVGSGSWRVRATALLNGGPDEVTVYAQRMNTPV